MSSDKWLVFIIILFHYLEQKYYWILNVRKKDYLVVVNLSTIHFTWNDNFWSYNIFYTGFTDITILKFFMKEEVGQYLEQDYNLIWFHNVSFREGEMISIIFLVELFTNINIWGQIFYTRGDKRIRRGLGLYIYQQWLKLVPVKILIVQFQWNSWFWTIEWHIYCASGQSLLFSRQAI